MAGAVRSRNYPAFDLGAALDRARKLYEREGKAVVASDVAVTAWGYSGLNGRSLRALGALRQFGLLEDAPNRSVRLSRRALTLLLEPDDSVERAEELKAAFLEPAAYKEIADQFADLPSDAALISHLTRNAGFNQDAAKSLNATYRASLDLVKGKADGNISPAAARPERPAGGREPSSRFVPKEGRMEFHWSLGGDYAASLTVSKRLPKAAVEILKGQLQLATQVIEMDALEPAPPSQPEA